MSFSGEVRDELLRHHEMDKGCNLAEMAALLMFCGKPFEGENGQLCFRFLGEYEKARQKVFTLHKKTFNMKSCVDSEMLVIPKDFPAETIDWRNPDVYESANCKRAFLRGAYICVGSMSDPEKSYHLEFDCANEDEALVLQKLLRFFELDARIVERKKYQVVYMKEGSAIGDLLNVVGAHVSLMNFENLRILKDMRNSINRKVNCETANIAKTVSAATKQVQDIELIRDSVGFGELSPALSEMAQLRLDYPDATLQELGDLLEPPVSKSGVNHRLKKLCEIAEQIRLQ